MSTRWSKDSHGSIISAKIKSRRSDSHGSGIYAISNIPSGEKLAIFGGPIIRATEEVGDWGIQIDEEFVISGAYPGHHVDASTTAAFFNHSCDPNCGIKGSIFLFAMRDILIGEQVTFDYATCLHRVDGLPPYRLKCRCNSPNCRKLVTDDDWKLKDLQLRYKGWFSWYLQEKIDCDG